MVPRRTFAREQVESELERTSFALRGSELPSGSARASGTRPDNHVCSTALAHTHIYTHTYTHVGALARIVPGGRQQQLKQSDGDEVKEGVYISSEEECEMSGSRGASRRAGTSRLRAGSACGERGRLTSPLRPHFQAWRTSS